MIFLHVETSFWYSTRVVFLLAMKMTFNSGQGPPISWQTARKRRFAELRHTALPFFLPAIKSNTATRAVLGISPVHDHSYAGSCMSFSVREQVGDLSAGFDGS